MDKQASPVYQFVHIILLWEMANSQEAIIYFLDCNTKTSLYKQLSFRY